MRWNSSASKGLLGSLARGYEISGLSFSFLPNAALFLPIVKRLAIDFVNRSFRDLHVARATSQKKIDVVRFAVGRFHIDAGEISAAAEIGEPVVMHFDQIEGQILALIRNVKFLVAGCLSLAGDMLFDSRRNIPRAHFLRLGRRLWCSIRWHLHCCWPMRRHGMLGTDRGDRCEQRHNRYCDNESCNHGMGMGLRSIPARNRLIAQALTALYR